MSDSLDHKLIEAIPQADRDAAANPPPLDDMPGRTHEDVAEQTRESQESDQAHKAQAGSRERLIELGEASHTGGHSRGRGGDK